MSSSERAFNLQREPIDGPEASDEKASITSLAGFQSYLSYRTPAALAIGGTIGATTGFYAGDAMALYGYTYGIGFGIVTTSFYSGIYGMKALRQKDDAINYAVSGSLTSSMLGIATGGPRRGAWAGLAGIFGGVAMQYIGDWFYNTSRSSWINYRRITIEESRPRILDTRLKKKLPKDGEYYSEREVVTLRTDQWPTWMMATKQQDSEMYRADPKPPADKIPGDKLV